MTISICSAMPRARCRFRTCLTQGVLVLLAVLAVRTWWIEGLIVPCQVVGGSMATTLLGPHRDVTCDDCGHRFACGADLRPVGLRAVCPNCGYAGNDLAQRPDLSGDRLLLDKSAFRLRSPRRWEVVALRSPQQARRILVKRVVGLPGESVQIRHGDLYIDGRLQRKSLRQQKALAILVHDANHQPTLGQPSNSTPTSETLLRPRAATPRWQGIGKDSRWRAQGGRFAHPAAAQDEPIDWLVYRHRSRAAGTTGETNGRPVTDVCGYNQTRPRRSEDTHVVTDLLLSLRLIETSGAGTLVVRARGGEDDFRLQIDPVRGRYEVLRNGHRPPVTSGTLPGNINALVLDVSVIDRQFLWAVDGRVVGRPLTFGPSQQSPDSSPLRQQGIGHSGATACKQAVPLQSTPSRTACKQAVAPSSGTLFQRAAGTTSPLAIGSHGLAVVINDLHVYRDVYYTHPAGPLGLWGLDTPVRLAGDEYFVLGDNSPISEDSRTWPQGAAVHRKLFVGKPLLVHFPARHVRFGRWRFQVPDLARIRYIR